MDLGIDGAGYVELWWYVLCVISIFNIGAWFFSYRILRQNSHGILPEILKGRIIIAWLSFVYVLVCAFRSFLPRIDLERIVLLDHWLSSVFFIGASPTSYALIQGIAAGAMLTMIAETMLPEAYFKGGSEIGISTLMGFLVAIFSKTLE